MAGFAKGSTKETREKEGRGPVEARRPQYASGCGHYMRRKLTQEFEGIVDGFVKEAKTGSCQHVKLVTELLKPLPKPKNRKKGSASALLEKWEREDAAVAAKAKAED